VGFPVGFPVKCPVVLAMVGMVTAFWLSNSSWQSSVQNDASSSTVSTSIGMVWRGVNVLLACGVEGFVESSTRDVYGNFKDLVD